MSFRTDKRKKRQKKYKRIGYIFFYLYLFLFYFFTEFSGRASVASKGGDCGRWRHSRGRHGNGDTEDSALSWEAGDIKAFFCSWFFVFLYVRFFLQSDFFTCLSVGEGPYANVLGCGKYKKEIKINELLPNKNIFSLFVALQILIQICICYIVRAKVKCLFFLKLK